MAPADQAAVDAQHPPTVKVKVCGREVFVLGPGKREILVSRAATKRQAIQQLSAFVDARCAELGL